MRCSPFHCTLPLLFPWPAKAQLDCASAVGCASIEPGKNAQSVQSLRLPCGNMNCRAAPSMKDQRQDTRDTEKARKEGTKKSSLRTPTSSAVMSSARYAMGPAGCEILPGSMFAHVSPLEYALTKKAPASHLESALTKTKDLNYPEMNTYRKTGVGGSPLPHPGQHRGLG